MKGLRPKPARWRRPILLGAGVPALCLGTLFASWVVIPHLRVECHRRVLASKDPPELSEAARSLARIGTEEAVRALLVALESALEEENHPEDGRVFWFSEGEHVIRAFRDLPVKAMPAVVDHLCKSDLRGGTAASLAFSGFLGDFEESLESEDASEDPDDIFSRLEKAGVHRDLVAKARSCCEEIAKIETSR